MLQMCLQVSLCHFSLYVAEKLKSFSQAKRAFAENRINDILFELEMQEVNHNTKITVWSILYREILPEVYCNVPSLRGRYDDRGQFSR